MTEPRGPVGSWAEPVPSSLLPQPGGVTMETQGWTQLLSSQVTLVNVPDVDATAEWPLRSRLWRGLCVHRHLGNFQGDTRKPHCAPGRGSVPCRGGGRRWAVCGVFAEVGEPLAQTRPGPRRRRGGRGGAGARAPVGCVWTCEWKSSRWGRWAGCPEEPQAQGYGGQARGQAEPAPCPTDKGFGCPLRPPARAGTLCPAAQAS